MNDLPQVEVQVPRTRPSAIALLLGLSLVACGGDAGVSDEDEGGSGGGSGEHHGGGGGGAGGARLYDQLPATPRVARLSHQQWRNAVADLLALPPSAIAFDLNGDPTVGRFDDNGQVLQVDQNLWRDYQAAAESLALTVTRDPKALARILPSDLPSDLDGKARAFLSAFGERAFRRPLAGDELDAFRKLFDVGAQVDGTGDAWVDGVRIAIEAFLQSPHFLYREELSTDVVDGRVPLEDHELAAKLALSLTGTIPDAELLAAARDRRLRNADELARQAERLLDGERARASLQDFHHQLLRLKTYEAIDKDAQAYPAFVAGIGAHMQREALLFTDDVVFGRSGGVRDLLTSPSTFVDKALAPIYGQKPQGDDFARVDLDPKQRAGLLTLSGFLAANAYRNEIDSIHRGVFVHKNVLCTNLPPPAANVTPVPPDTAKTERQRVEAHTGKGTCGEGCHSTLINPAGFAFEHYDALGAYRTQDHGTPVDSSASLEIDGERRDYGDAIEFSALLANAAGTHRCYASELLEYVQGRTPADEDDGFLEDVGARSRDGKLSIKQIVLSLVTSPAFTSRAKENQP
jgi:hypothetical protein